jgi:hypothetical protein
MFLVIIHIQDNTEDDLSEVGSTLRLSRTIFRFRECRKEQRSKNRNDGDDNQQFNKAECRHIGGASASTIWN